MAQASRAGRGGEYRRLAWLVLALVLVAPRMVRAESDMQPAVEEEVNANIPAEPDSFWNRKTMTGDWGGLRAWLSAQGVNINLNYTSDFLDNVQGGIKQGGVYEGLLLGQIDVDLAKLVGWQGASFHISAMSVEGEPEGHGLTNGYVGSLLTVSNIEAAPTEKIYTVWLQQVTDAGAVSLRLGVLGIDDEFMISQTSQLFLGNTFAGVTNDLPAGGATYPLAAPAVRLALKPLPNVTWMNAVFDGDPTGGDGSTFIDEQQPSGTLFSFSGGVFLISELDVATFALPSAPAAPLVVKFGSWYGSGTHFASLRYDNQGISLASPDSNGEPRNHVGDWGAYGVADWPLYRLHAGSDQGVSAFLRASVSPSDENLVDRFADGGIVEKGLIPARPADLFGVEFAYSHVSSAERDFDLAERTYINPDYPLANYEFQLEETYQVQITKWWALQPDIQEYFHPGGNVVNPDGNLRKNALVMGMRLIASF